MIIGIPKEVKNNEYRVSCIPQGVKAIVERGHKVYVEAKAGEGSGFSDYDYELAGAEILERASDVYGKSDLIYKVKEIFPEEYKYLRKGLIVFTYIHSNAYREQTNALLETESLGIAYEDINDEDGEFPLLKPMSILAGKGGFLAALNHAQKVNKGKGILLSRVDGVRTPEITIIGAGNSGLGAAELAAAFGNKVTMLDISMNKLEKAREILPANVELLLSNSTNVEDCIKRSDVVINCILWPKWRNDHLIT